MEGTESLAGVESGDIEIAEEPLGGHISSHIYIPNRKFFVMAIYF